MRDRRQTALRSRAAIGLAVLVLAALVVLATLLVPAAAGGRDPWPVAHARLAYPLYEPYVALGLRLSRFEYLPCGRGRSRDSLYTTYGSYALSSHGASRGFELVEGSPEICANAAEFTALGTLRIDGTTAHLGVYCLAPARCTIADGVRNGYTLYWTNAATSVQLSSAHLTLAELVAVAAGLRPVRGQATAAAARRAPTRSEGKAIRVAVAGYASILNSPAAKDQRVVSITVSSVDPRYASVRLASKSRGPAVMVLHHSFDAWWVQQFGRTLGCDTAPKVVLDDLGIACRPPGASVWISNCSRLESRPASLVLTCADGNYELVRLKWRTWGAATATAAGTARVNDCKPDCAGGHFHDYPVKAIASDRTRCGVTPYYERLTVIYPGARLAWLPKRDRRVLIC